jgi:hypothetical protein
VKDLNLILLEKIVEYITTYLYKEIVLIKKKKTYYQETPRVQSLVFFFRVLGLVLRIIYYYFLNNFLNNYLFKFFCRVESYSSLVF